MRVYGPRIEFDCVGVIFGKDLVYNGGWSGNRKMSRHDNVVKRAKEEEFVNLVKQTYRVLLTRGMKGCYVFFEDTGTKDFFLSQTTGQLVNCRCLWSIPEIAKLGILRDEANGGTLSI